MIVQLDLEYLESQNVVKTPNTKRKYSNSQSSALVGSIYIGSYRIVYHILSLL